MHTNHDLPKPEGLFERIIQFSIQNAIWVMLFVCTWIAVGVYSYQKLPIDAVPDITNTQVQINTQANGYTALEVEQRITYPIETAMAGIPNLSQPIPGSPTHGNGGVLALSYLSIPPLICAIRRNIASAQGCQM